MTIDLTTDNIIYLVVTIISGLFAIWLKSLTAHNKVVEKNAEDIKKEFDDIWKSNNEIRDCLQETRENYVTNARFDKLFDMMMSKFDIIMNKLDDKRIGNRRGTDKGGADE